MSKLSFLLQTICFLFITTSSYSQKAIIKEIIETNPIRKEQNVFPLVTILGNNTATKKINKTLQEDLLYLDSTGYKKSIFEIAWDRENENNPGWEYTDFEYKVYSNTAHHLCLSVSFVGGKHVETQTVNYLFDNSTGENIELSKILTPDGQKWLLNQLVSTQKKRIQQLLPILEDSLKRPPNPLYQYDSLSREDFKEEIQLYKSCLEDYLKSYFSDGNSVEYLTFYIEEEMLIAEGFACGNRGFDELGEVKFSRPLKAISQYLTATGKKLLLALEK